MASDAIPWHRLFGIALMDFFRDSPFEVELEKDLSLKQQMLDVIILRKRPGTFHKPLPDGFENLVDHNLISFKSHQDALLPWSIKELLGHYVNYRKQVSLTMKQLLPETDFQMFAVTARFPDQLHVKVPLQEQRPGVHLCRWGTDEVRVLVLRDLPEEEHNALLHLFSAVPQKIQYAREHYRQQSVETSTLIQRLLKFYQKEGMAMPYTMEDFLREAKEEMKKEVLQELTREERLQGLSTEELLDILRTKQIIEKIPPEERLEGLSQEEIETILKKRQEQAKDTKNES